MSNEPVCSARRLRGKVKDGDGVFKFRCKIWLRCSAILLSEKFVLFLTRHRNLSLACKNQVVSVPINLLLLQESTQFRRSSRDFFDD